jgi:acetyl-CoA carboxylase biotin carboxyl carrier protein
MDLRKLKTLIDLVSESNISELEITEAEGKVRIVKGRRAVAPVMAGADAPWRPAPATVTAGRAAAAAAAGRAGGTGRAAGQGHQVADGRHLLPLAQPGRQGLRRGRRA